MSDIDQHNQDDDHSSVPQWLDWAREIQAIAQTGYHYANDEYHRQRFGRLIEIAAEIASEYSDLEYPYVLLSYQEQIGYATPRIDVRGAVFIDGQLLMVRERVDGGWTLPGGWADVGEIPSKAAEREVWEEAGYRVKARKLIGVYDANRMGRLELYHAYKIVFLCDLISGEAKPSIETSEVGFFEKNALPPVLSGERTKLRHIQDAFDCLNDPLHPSVFD
ncbi:MAG: NUDIX hydrolase [Anaerolineales bacterium]|nr:NUDIX hydrolase [Anaerolineae bacterium]PWB52368.1 MAG: NUDIX hydrolase [Anaerolineales bacterium]